MCWQIDSLERRAIDAVRQHGCSGRLPASARRLGLEVGEYHALCAALKISLDLSGETILDEDPPSLLPKLIALLWAHRTSDFPVSRAMAGAVASACFGERHLWQDLGLSGRQEVSALLERHFKELAIGNTRNLKWKRYLFLRLGDSWGIADLRPPRCAGCEEFAQCFPAPGLAEATIIRISPAQSDRSS